MGRTYIMTTRVESSFAHTRGNPIVYLAVVAGPRRLRRGEVAVTAFH